MVASSGMDIWKPPSPTSANTSLSGRANCAPMAAGRPKPMEPRPPELIHSRGSLKRINCAAHIWCWPTSELTMAWPPREAVDFGHQVLRLDLGVGRRRLAADAPPSRRGSAATRRGARRPLFVRRRSGFSASSLFSLPSTRLTSPTMGTSGRAILADFGRVDIHVDHLGVRREGRQAAGDAIVEAHAQGDQQVAIGHPHVGGVAAVHARHADEVGMARRAEPPRPISVMTAGMSASSTNSRKFRRRVGRDDAAAGVDQRPLALPQISCAARRIWPVWPSVKTLYPGRWIEVTG